MNIDGARTVLTGASRGMGPFIAKALANKGARLVLAARDEVGLERTRAELAAAGFKADVVRCDVGDRESRRALAATGEVDILVNNAGVEECGIFAEMDEDVIERVLRINLEGTIALTRLVLPGMLARNRGHVVNVASMAGLAPTAFGEVYSASKHGVVGFSKSLRATLKAKGSLVSCSAVCPGYVTGAGMFADNMQKYGSVPPAAMGSSTPEQVADAIVAVITRDLPDRIVNAMPMRPNLALITLFPRLMEQVMLLLKVHKTMENNATHGKAR
jgi:short-subunit dehydrogenase